MCDCFCSSLSLFILRFTLVELFKQKHKKCGKIYVQVYACIKTIKTIDQSFMTSLKIDLQQSHIDFKIFLTKINVHTKQVKLIMHYAISTKVLDQTHMWYTQHKQSNFLEIFQFLWVFEFFNSLKNRTSKVRSTKRNRKNSK